MRSMMTRGLWAALILCLGALPAFAGDRVAVELQLRQETRQGESVYVVGDRPELGAWDVTKALRLSPASYPTWSIRIALPAGTRYQYRFLIRSNAPDQLADPRNANLEAQRRSAVVPGRRASRIVRLRYFSGFVRPKLRYRRAEGAWRSADFQLIGAGRGPGEQLWELRVETLEEQLEFVAHDGSGSYDRAPERKNYRSPMSDIVLQDGQLHPGIPKHSDRVGRVVRVPGWRSNRLGNSREIAIYLPRGYERSGKRYPVLYMHDGQNLFGPEAMFGGWRVAAAADRLIAAGQVEELIIVGVGNTAQRMSEYVPAADGGRAEDYAAFLVDELKPWVDRSLRTKPEAAETGVAGSSLGGLVSFYLGFSRPETFTRLGCISSSFFFNADAKLRLGRKRPAGLKLWLDSGSAGPSADGLEGTIWIRDQLLNLGYAQDGDMHHEIDLGARHNEAFWRRRIGRVLGYLFPAR